MSSSRPNPWGQGGDWRPYTADGQPQYHTTSGAEDVGGLGRGMSDLDLGAHGHGHGLGQVYSHDSNYAPDGSSYAANAYTPRSFPSSTRDQNYTHAPPESTWQDRAASSSKGKTKALVSTTKSKTKTSREKERERNSTKDRSSSSKQNSRPKAGKSHNPAAPVEELDPFYGPRPPKGNDSPVDNSPQETDDDRNHQPAAAAYGSPEEGPRFQTPTPGDFSRGHDAYHASSTYSAHSAYTDPSGYPYTEQQYNYNAQAIPASSKPSKTRSGKSRREEPAVDYQDLSYSAQDVSSVEEDPDEALARAIASSDGYMAVGPHASESSDDYGPSYMSPGYEEDAGGQVTPRPTSPAAAALPGNYEYGANAIATDPTTGYGTTEELDVRYVVEPSNRFTPGEVFKILWSEPLGAGGRTENMSVWGERSHLGQKFYIGFRRFIVVANDEGHCTCVPILTYERRACTKRGVKPQKHGIVYQVGSKPRTLVGEPKLGFPPVRMELDDPSEKLAAESRVNYSKLVTVEHNVKVFFVGRIVRQDFEEVVSEAVDNCWQGKKRQSESRSNRHTR
ncbi:hypothetical protein B0T19DRAFT_179198 [Cercophora scortea]|uniref:DUF6590 domain-containing protein n=1 Tax=Cercophora scortea TaxID=314031 RepID=A0AAE0IN06_9PEZI|nr:hypothetical protein B0T19DRAFT_179198 [Cercophora scortea]